MILYGSFETATELDTPAGIPRIDFMELEFTKPLDSKFVPEDLENNTTGMILSVDWDESEWDYNPETGKNEFRCKGIQINQVYANGSLELFQSAIIDTVQLYVPGESQITVPFKFLSLGILDGEQYWEFPEEAIATRFVDVVCE